MKKLKSAERHSSRRYKVMIRRLLKQGFTTQGLLNSLSLIKSVDKNGSFSDIVASQHKNGFPRTLHDKHMPDFRKLVIR
ncbi:hypothetical protein [Burkholderia phage FLC9]|nr:hypothetical protein [Burkholderia phage FLC9]